MDYFLTGREGWCLSEQEFIQLLTSRWPSAFLRSVDIPGGSRSVDFRIPMAESLLDGHFNLEGSTVVFYGAIRDCAQFALWYQAALPKGRPFLLFDEGYTHSVELRTDTTVEDIISVLHGAPRT